MLLDTRLPWALSLFLLDWACFGILPLSFSFFFNVGFINFATPLLWSCAWLWDFLSTYRTIELFFDFCSVLQEHNLCFLAYCARRAVRSDDRLVPARHLLLEVISAGVPRNPDEEDDGAELGCFRG